MKIIKNTKKIYEYLKHLIVHMYDIYEYSGKKNNHSIKKKSIFNKKMLVIYTFPLYDFCTNNKTYITATL